MTDKILKIFGRHGRNQVIYIPNKLINFVLKQLIKFEITFKNIIGNYVFTNAYRINC